jgi:hypothetical protein
MTKLKKEKCKFKIDILFNIYSIINVKELKISIKKLEKTQNTKK